MMIMRKLALAAWLALGAVAGCVSQPEGTVGANRVGVLVMAHGGSADWNQAVETMLEPVGRDYPLQIAFGMAESASLQEGVRRLEAQGLDRIAVVRLFIAGESWYERTEQILGLRPGADGGPPESAKAPGHAGHTDHDHDGAAPWRIKTRSAFALSTQGLADAPEMGLVLADRARALSRDPARESVLILAHGPEDDAENERWLARLSARADAVRAALPFRRVGVESLREDWPDKRAAAEARIRAFVTEAAQGGGRAIVVPFRVQGFGPYAGVLEGLPYVADGRGLIPHPQVERWVRRQVEELRAGPFRRPE